MEIQIDIIDIVESKRLRWYGHVRKMPVQRSNTEKDENREGRGRNVLTRLRQKEIWYQLLAK